MKPPPGFEEAFAAPCPSCGQPVGEHEPSDHHEHLIIYLADEDRTADEILEYYYGVLKSITHLFKLGLPPWAVASTVDFQIEQIHEALRRRGVIQ